MNLNISQASRAANKSRKTIYRHIETGKLSAQKDTLGNTVIDIVELERVYGSIKVDEKINATDSTSQKVVQSVSSKQSDTADVEALKAELKLFKRELEIEKERRVSLEEEKQRMLGIIESQAASMKQLAPSQNAQKKGFWSRLFSKS